MLVDFFGNTKKVHKIESTDDTAQCHVKLPPSYAIVIILLVLIIQDFNSSENAVACFYTANVFCLAFVVRRFLVTLLLRYSVHRARLPLVLFGMCACVFVFVTNWCRL